MAKLHFSGNSGSVLFSCGGASRSALGVVASPNSDWSYWSDRVKYPHLVLFVKPHQSTFLGQQIYHTSPIMLPVCDWSDTKRPCISYLCFTFQPLHILSRVGSSNLTHCGYLVQGPRKLVSSPATFSSCLRVFGHSSLTPWRKTSAPLEQLGSRLHSRPSNEVSDTSRLISHQKLFVDRLRSGGCFAAESCDSIKHKPSYVQRSLLRARLLFNDQIRGSYVMLSYLL